MEEKNKYSKKLTITLIIFILSIILISFFVSKNKYIITYEIIICLMLAMILVLADSFDNLSIPKLLSLSKNIKDVKKENDDLKEANIKLLEQVVSIKNSNSQNIYLPSSFRTIGSSDINDIKKVEENESVSDQVIEDSNNLSNERNSVVEKYKYRNVFKIYLLKKALIEERENPNIQYDVKIINNKPLEDNIMKNEVRFDALKMNVKDNVFYEVKISPFWVDYTYQLHYKLRMLELYQEATKSSSKLVLIIPSVDKDLEKMLFNRLDDRFSFLKEKIVSKFEPAIENGLLEILQLSVTKKELDEYITLKEEN